MQHSAALFDIHHFQCSAQDKKGLHRNICLELLGPYGVGPSFDSRFAPESPFGYRLVTDKGFQFRIGIPPTFNYAKDSGISFGWSF